MSWGGGLVTQPGSEQGIHFNSDGSWEINSSYSRTQTNYKVYCQDGEFSVLEYTGDFSSSPDLKTGLVIADGGAQIFGTSSYNEAEIQPRIGVNSGQNAISLEAEYNSEANKTNGIYINAVNTANAGISFIDSTVDSENPTKRYFLKDFALKSDITAGVDLTDYQGDWKLSKEDQIDGRTYTSTFEQSTISSESGTYPISKLIQYGYNTSGQPIEYGFCNNPSAGAIIYRLEGITYDELLNGNIDNKSYTAYQQNANTMISGTFNNGLYTTSMIVCDTSNISLSIRGSSQHNVSNIILERTGDISFGYTQANEYKSINLSVLVDRIAQLESTVAELQTQLAAKANTASPTFTGKVLINSSN